MAYIIKALYKKLEIISRTFEKLYKKLTRHLI
jgi:hypothetical protein